MKIPDSITVNTGEQEENHRNIESFLLEAKSEFEKKVGRRQGPSRFRTEVRQICKSSAGNPLPSDDFVHMLYYRQKVIAAVFETRTDSNYVQFDYFFNPKILFF